MREKRAKRPLLRVGSAAEVAPRLEEEPGEGARLEPVRVEERERRRGSSRDRPAAPAAACDFVEAGERARRRTAGRRVGLQAVVGHDERDAVRRQLPLRRRAGAAAAATEARRGVLRAVEHDEERDSRRVADDADLPEADSHLEHPGILADTTAVIASERCAGTADNLLGSTGRLQVDRGNH